MLFCITTNKDVISPLPDQNEFDKFLNYSSHYVDFNTVSNYFGDYIRTTGQYKIELDYYVILATKRDFLGYKKSLCLGNVHYKLNYSGTYK